jgi:hypothetical protein
MTIDVHVVRDGHHLVIGRTDPLRHGKWQIQPAAHGRVVAIHGVKFAGYNPQLVREVP